MSEERKNNQLEEELEEEELEEEVEEEVEEEDNKKDSKGSAGKSGGKEDKGKGRTFTQEQVNRMMTKEKKQGRNSVYKELGIDPKDSKSIAMVKALIDSQKTDEEKAAEKENENQARISEAEERAAIAEAKAEAMMLGVKPQFVEDAITLALSKIDDENDIKTVIGEFKTKYPVWFGESNNEGEEGKGKTGHKGTGSSVKSDKRKEGSEAKGLGARLAAQRKSGNKKSSYWGK